MNYQEIINGVSHKTGLQHELVDKTYKAYWKVIREMIAGLPLKDDLTDDEFNDLRCSFNIPSLGKLSVTKDRYFKVKKRLKVLRDAAENKKD